MSHFTDTDPARAAAGILCTVLPALSFRCAVRPDARALMRSRYSAFVTHNADHLIRTWYPPARAEALRTELTAGFGETEWLGLNVIDFQPAPRRTRLSLNFVLALLIKVRR